MIKNLFWLVYNTQHWPENLCYLHTAHKPKAIETENKLTLTHSDSKPHSYSAVTSAELTETLLEGGIALFWVKHPDNKRGRTSGRRMRGVFYELVLSSLWNGRKWDGSLRDGTGYCAGAKRGQRSAYLRAGWAWCKRWWHRRSRSKWGLQRSCHSLSPSSDVCLGCRTVAAPEPTRPINKQCQHMMDWV